MISSQSVFSHFLSKCDWPVGCLVQGDIWNILIVKWSIKRRVTQFVVPQLKWRDIRPKHLGLNFPPFPPPPKLVAAKRVAIVIVNTASYYFLLGPDVVFIQVKLSMGLNSLPFHCQLVEIFYWILIWRATSWKKGLCWTGLILCRAWTRQFFWLKGELWRNVSWPTLMSQQKMEMWNNKMLTSCPRLPDTS